MVQSTSEVPKGPLQVLVYPGPDCHGSLYQDDGNTLDYQRGDFLRMKFACDSRPDILKLEFSTPQAQYKPWWKSMRVTFYGVPAKPRNLILDGKAVGNWQFNAANSSVTLDVPAATAGKIAITK